MLGRTIYFEDMCIMMLHCDVCRDEKAGESHDSIVVTFPVVKSCVTLQDHEALYKKFRCSLHELSSLVKLAPFDRCLSIDRKSPDHCMRLFAPF